ncbi:tetratricopeptide repeat protein [Saccharothrix variisporea]|uniref:Tetratricopeptide repeat protein n=1 Tax=Saccharothrix variisporea TaxID=543527 RepID=A0A495XAV9_9PSEU|nr:tetratricopeptide repeat protein [Saccharothrix variisporea]RKT69984.1 tetratricopeptide repeat protein [Saccharothrix variisporea]
MADELRVLWDFSDLPGTEARFRARLAEPVGDAERAEVLTQLARVEGLRGDTAAGQQLLAEAEALAAPDSAGRVRVFLERGRLLRSAGAPEEALPLFVAAFVLAGHLGEEFLAADAAHMAALVDNVEEWTARGVEIASASEDPQVRYWVGPLLNNLGWAHYESGRFDEALEAFRIALAAREETSNEVHEVEIARYAVAKTLRALGRPAEAAELMGHAVAVSPPDGWFHEELAEDYAALGWHAEAAEQATKALELLDAHQPPDRVERLHQLASAAPPAPPPLPA